MESMDIVAQNVENIGNLFPDCITEARDENGKIQKVVDRDRLMQKFSHKIIGGKTERYEFTWVGKMLQEWKQIRLQIKLYVHV